MENQEINPLKNPEEYQRAVLDSMKKYELLIGELYAFYAEKFPEQKDFWSEISREEGTHAYWLKTLEEKIGGGQVFLNEERFHINPIRLCIEDIEQRISMAKNSEIDLLAAISISNEIERGMIEKNFFEVFEADSAEIKETFGMLKRATLQHREKVEALWEQARLTGRVSAEGKNKSFWEKIKHFFS